MIFTVSSLPSNVHDVHIHRRDPYDQSGVIHRNPYGGIDIETAKLSLHTDRAWRTHNANDRETYEGSYHDNTGTHYFRVVVSKYDGHVISAIRLNQAPIRPSTNHYY